jgi:hypothetical protein
VWDTRRDLAAYFARFLFGLCARGDFVLISHRGVCSVCSALRSISVRSPRRRILLLAGFVSSPVCSTPTTFLCSFFFGLLYSRFLLIGRYFHFVVGASRVSARFQSAFSGR